MFAGCFRMVNILARIGITFGYASVRCKVPLGFTAAPFTIDKRQVAPCPKPGNFGGYFAICQLVQSQAEMTLSIA